MSEVVIVYISSFPPRECGIATFTQDLSAAVDELISPAVQSRIAAMNSEPAPRCAYPGKVIFQVYQNDTAQYADLAVKINHMPGVKLVNIQHEFGLHGGDYGMNLLAFLEKVKKPVVTTLHTVLPEPNPDLLRATKMLAEHSATLVALTHTSAIILHREYAVPEAKLMVIPHGIPPYPFSPPGTGKKKLGLEGKSVLATFGLLSRGKGIEYVIEALPAVVARHQDVVYNVAGLTHPNILKEEGESYREYLERRVKDLGLTGVVRFTNKFLETEELFDFLKGTDIYICTSLDPNQAVSGTLSNALGMGIPVISTPFAQAKEYITPEVGLLAEFASPDSYSSAILKFLDDESWRISLGKNAYFRTRHMAWPNVALRYLQCFAKCAPEIGEISWQKTPPPVKLDHVKRLTDDFGIVQFASITEPDPSSGYTLDDNARALVALSLLYSRTNDQDLKKELLGLIKIYLAFITYVAKPDGTFSNYVTKDKRLDHRLNRRENLEDACGRAFYALSYTWYMTGLPADIRDRAFTLCRRVMEKGVTVSSPRAMAFHIKGLCHLLELNAELPGVDLKGILTTYCDKLAAMFQRNSAPEWAWFEDRLTYANEVLPDALLRAFKVTAKQEYFDVGKQALEFLISEGFINGIYVPVGQRAWHHRHGRRSRFDQQPVGVTTMLMALESCAAIRGEERLRMLMRRAFNWFLGDNVSSLIVYDRVTGGCCDGLGEDHVNLNEGAESTLSYLMARLIAFEGE